MVCNLKETFAERRAIWEGCLELFQRDKLTEQQGGVGIVVGGG